MPLSIILLFGRNENILNTEKSDDIFLSSVMDGFDKKTVLSRLREMGMDTVANKLEPMSKKDIEHLIGKNPEILKKASEILKNGR